MLVLTDNASAVISSIMDRSEMPAGAGLRIAAPADGRDPFTISTAATPSQADQVVEEHGARVFLTQDAAEMLDDKVLDARVSDDGGVQFLLAAQ